MPSELSLFNLYHANTSSSKRYWALHVLSDLCCKERLPLLELAVIRTDRLFAANHSALFWKGMEIPRVFFRSKNIPICPECIKEKAYVPVYWHLELVRACPKHQCELIFQCPECGQNLDYIRDAELVVCQCGFDLLTANKKTADAKLVDLAAKIYGLSLQEPESDNPLSQEVSIETAFGQILWYFLWVSDSKVPTSWSDDSIFQSISFFERWPSQLLLRLDDLAKNGIEYADRPMNETAFRAIFGSLLRVSRHVPDSSMETNMILKAVFSYFDPIVFDTNHKYAEIAQTLLDSYEASTILGIGGKQLARLVEEGMLHPCHQLKANTSIRPDQPLFRLRDVFLLWAVRFQSKYSNRSFYLSRW